MRILQVICSPHGRASESAQLSSKIIEALLGQHAKAEVVVRVLADDPLGPIDANYALSQHGPEDVSQEGTAAISALLVRELQSADAVVIGTPIHNFTVPAALKAWIDHIVRVRWTFDVSPEGKIGKLKGRPVFIAYSSGGRFGGEGAHQPDFLTPYLRAVFAITGLRDIRFFSVQGAAFGAGALAQSRLDAQAAVSAHFARPEALSEGCPP